MNPRAEEYLRNSYMLASQSRDKSNQNGATLVNVRGDIIGTGSNNFPMGVEFTIERSETRPDKYRYFEHAERNCLYCAARAGLEVAFSTMYCQWAACCDCARGIIQTGVSTLVLHTQRMQMTPERWIDDVNEALRMLAEGGVDLQYFDGPVTGCPDIIVNGELWNPANPPSVGQSSSNWFVGMNG